MRRLFVVGVVLGAGLAWADRPVDGWRSQLADDAAQGTSAEALNELAKKAGAASFGALVKTIPADDLAAALGAAHGGDGQAVKSALAKGLLKSLAALGAEVAVGISAGAAAPVIAAIGAAFLAGQVFDTLVADDAADAQARLRALDVKLELAKEEAERSKLKLERELLVGQLLVLQADATSLRLDRQALVAKYFAKQLSQAEYEQAWAALAARSGKIVKDYGDAVAKLKGLAPTNDEARLAELKARHRALKEQVDASGGQDHAAYLEMKAVYQEYMALKKALEKKR